MTSPTQGSSPDHATHDQLLIAAAAAGDTLTPPEAATVAARLTTCADCRDLHADLLAIAASLRTDLPVPTRLYDFRLSPSQAAAARPPSWRQRLGTILSGPTLRPLAAAMCALGLVLAVGGAVIPGAGSLASLTSAGAAPIPPGAPSDTRGTALGGVEGQSVPGTTPAATGAPAPDAGSSGGNVSDIAPSPPAIPAPGGLFGSSGPPHPTGVPIGVVTVPNGGAGDLATGGIPPVAAPTVGGATLDLWPAVTVAGVALFLLGLGGLYLARRRAPPGA